ncbi:MAG: LPP20 family lipoprotein [Bacteroidales bacterium]|nr:LPP20 family lipoprotein [Bacteroidales bacterium]
MKAVFTLFLIIAGSFYLSAQSIESIKADRQNYIWGEGRGTTLKKADNEALAMLINQISTEVESNFTMLRDEKQQNGESAYSETVHSVVNTYSNASLKNTERIVVSNEPDAQVFRYIKRSEISKIFEARKQKILGFVSNGQMALNNLMIADALRYYYWALTLLRSHPDGNNISITAADGTQQLLATWLPFQIQNIMNSIESKIMKIEKLQGYTQVQLAISYLGKPVRNFDYSYWDGQNWSNIVSAKDGLGFADLPKATGDIAEVQLKAEYLFEGEAAVDNELRDVMEKIDPVPFKNAYFKTATGGATIAPIQPEPLPEIAPVVETSTATYDVTIKKLVTAINSGNYTSVQSLFTESGYQLFTQLVQYGKSRVLSSDNLQYMKFGDKTQCRALRMNFGFSNNTRSFVEDLVLSFDASGKICDLTLGLGQNAIQDILKQDAWSETVRLSLIDFMEHYKTAFALKRLDYIRNIFSDDALIITGWVTKAQPSKEFPYQNNQIVKYNRYTKEEYLKRLEMAFGSNEFINLKFNDNNIRKSGKGGEVYGIQIQQDYFSSSYGDSGYLFLLIDLNDSAQPVIHVRTWQPEKNPDGSIYGVENF